MLKFLLFLEPGLFKLFVVVHAVQFQTYSFAMQGMYEDSIRYYVRALAMNPKADNAWQYLRISLRYIT